MSESKKSIQLIWSMSNVLYIWNVSAQQTLNIVTMLWYGRNVIKTIYKVLATLMTQSQITVTQRWIVSSTHIIPWALYWQRCCNVEIKTSNFQHRHKVDTTTSNLPRRSSIEPKLDNKFTWQYIVDVVTLF